jgi:hypothetical protein
MWYLWYLWYPGILNPRREKADGVFSSRNVHDPVWTAKTEIAANSRRSDISRQRTCISSGVQYQQNRSGLVILLAVKRLLRSAPGG